MKQEQEQQVLITRTKKGTIVTRVTCNLDSIMDRIVLSSILLVVLTLFTLTPLHELFQGMEQANSGNHALGNGPNPVDQELDVNTGSQLDIGSPNLEDRIRGVASTPPLDNFAPMTATDELRDTLDGLDAILATRPQVRLASTLKAKKKGKKDE